MRKKGEYSARGNYWEGMAKERNRVGRGRKESQEAKRIKKGGGEGFYYHV